MSKAVLVLVDKTTEQDTTAIGGKARICDLDLKALDRVPTGIAVVRGSDHRLVYVNTAYRDLFGPRPLDRPFLETFGDLAQAGYALLLDRVMTTGEPIVLSESPVTVDYPAGRQERYFNISLFPVTLEDGERAVMSLALDVTSRVNAEERDLALRRYASLVRAGAVVEWSASAADGSVQLARGWEEVTGQRREEHRGHGWLNAVAPDDRPALALAWSRAVDEVPDVFEYTFRVRTRDGAYRHFRTRAVPVRKDGAVVEWTGFCADVEQQWREQRRADLLARASAATSETTRVEDTLNALSHVIVPALADTCTIYLVPDPETRPLGSRFISERVAWAMCPGLPTLPSHRRDRFAPYDAFVQVTRQRSPLHRTFPPGQPPSGLLPDDTVRWLREARGNSFVLLPLVVEGSVVAVLAAVTCGDREPINQDDVDLLTDILDHVRPAVDTVAEFQRTHRVALALQHSLLGEPPKVPGLSIIGRYQPSPTASHVGGDWYDAFTVDDAVMLAIGDIAGHDLSAAIAMSQLRNMLRAFAVDRPNDPREALRRLDNAMEKSREYGGTATCVLARVEQDGDHRWQVRYSVAGHPPPLLVLPDGSTRFLEGVHDILLGLNVEHPRHSAVEPLPPGSTLLLYTDGLVEDPDEHFDTGLERLARHCAATAGEPLDRFCDRLFTDLPTAGNDDITMIALRLAAHDRPPPQSGEAPGIR